ncbi:MAG TPA: DUF4239 domain-containing protein [Isosphaeraceae bacterium]|nr:DUF4239 domain-containing protein [Isosphaeraceae bacterium]
MPLGALHPMTMYWIYDLPIWQLAFLIVCVFVGVAVMGLIISRPLVRRLLGGSTEYNELVSYFLSSVGVFYGLALGLIAVATWQNFTDTDELVAREAAAIAGLYDDLDSLPQPARGRLENKMREYTRFIIQRDWPVQMRGQILDEGARLLDDFQNEMVEFEPKREQEKIAQSEVLKSFNNVVEQRRLRLQAVTTGLPASLWVVVIIGALLTIAITYLFWLRSLALHALLVSLLTIFMALLIFLMAAMDNPFRGDFSVSADPYQAVLDSVMKPAPEK